MAEAYLEVSYWGFGVEEKEGESIRVDPWRIIEDEGVQLWESVCPWYEEIATEASNQVVFD